MLTNCLKGLAVIAIIMASPVFVVFAAPFGWGMANDLLKAAGGPAALAVTAAACLAAFFWARHRPREGRASTPRLVSPTPRPIKSLG